MLLTTLVAALSLLDTVPQDLLFLKRSPRPLRGSVTARSDKEVVFNPYFSTHEAMVWGVQRLPANSVKSIRADLPPAEEFWLRLAKEKSSADDLCALAEFCKKKRLKDERILALQWALRADPAHAAARKALGSGKADGFVHSDPLANPQLAAELGGYLKIEDQKGRLAKAKELIKTYGLAWDEVYFERAYRSHKQPRGTTEDRKLTMRGDAVKGVYTLYVPQGYDPFQPTALILLLHGGGQDGDKVIGNGKQQLTLFIGSLSGLNYIAVCPDALRAPWASPINDPLVRAVLDEAEVLFNIDLNRVFVAGHSMGGYGTWHFGPKYCERFAAMAPMCGGGSNGLKKLRDTKTFVYLYHGGDDTRVRPDDSQAAAKRMLDDGNDFVYTQLPNMGHSCPSSVVAEMFACFARKRLTIGKRTQVRERSSFLRRQGRDEIGYFGKLETH